MITKNYLKTTPLCKVTFSLPKEAIQGAKEVRVLGDFNNWDWERGIPMTAGKEALTAEIGLEVGQTYQFRYKGDNQVWENDWQADKYATTPFGIENSVIEIPTQLTVVETPVKPSKKVATKKTTAKKTTTKKATTAKAKTATKKVAPKAKATTKKATITKAKTTAKKDDLKKIEGIGPKIAGLLNADGIITFADLAKAKQTTLKKVLADAGNRFKMHDPTSWPKQAKLAAAGKMAELKKLQDELKGGRAKK